VIETIPAPLQGERLDRVVALVTGRSRAEAAALVDAGAVCVGGRPVTARTHRVAEGDVLEIDLPVVEQDGGPVADASIAFTVVHADDDVAVIDKPAGLVVHPGAGNAEGTLVHGLLARFPQIAAVGEPDRPGIVHRLDRDTSGLMVVALSDAAYTGLVAQLSGREVDRRYRTVVWGHPEAARGIVDAPIGRSDREPTRMAVTERGREARTRYEVVATFTEPIDAAELVCRLETGRTHQIRVHLAAIGHPVLGDTRYGGERESFPVSRFYLHAEHLAFHHPVTDEWREFDSALPEDLREIRARLT
jgi:23S rRNA pseudouridine1911/1915/1917 synthase